VSSSSDIAATSAAACARLVQAEQVLEARARGGDADPERRRVAGQEGERGDDVGVARRQLAGGGERAGAREQERGVELRPRREPQCGAVPARRAGGRAREDGVPRLLEDGDGRGVPRPARVLHVVRTRGRFRSSLREGRGAPLVRPEPPAARRRRVHHGGRADAESGSGGARRSAG
jgi:hypothetical protein